MAALNRRSLLALAALIAAAALTGSTPPQGVGATGSALTAQAEQLGRSESTALLQLYAAEASFARAQADVARLQQRADHLAEAERGAARRAGIVRRSLTASQNRVAALLRELYVQGEPDPIAVVLGATSLDEVVAGIDGLSRATAMNERLGIEAEGRARELARVRRTLAKRHAGLVAARDAAAAGSRRLARAVASRRQTLAVIRERRSLTAQRINALRTRAEVAGRQSLELTSQAASTEGSAGAPTPAASSSAPAVSPQTASGTRTMVADVVAYHLAGSTASGLPVGVGVVAVDPTVIPLGTRLFVPGYGPAVAADVGSAVKGNIIDLWMPSMGQARAWGRRTVTITVYG